MRTLIFITLAIAAIATAALVTALPHVSARFAEARIVSFIDATTGEKVDIRGKTTVTVLPFPAVTMRDVEVGGGARPEKTPRLTTASLRASLRVLPLLSGRIEPKSLTLDEARIWLDWDASDEGPRQLLSKLLRLVDHPLFAAARDGGVDEIVLQEGAIWLAGRRRSRSEKITDVNMRFAWGANEPRIALAGSMEWRRRSINLSARFDNPQELFTAAGSEGQLTIAARPQAQSQSVLDLLEFSSRRGQGNPFWRNGTPPIAAAPEGSQAFGPYTITGVFKAAEGDTVAVDDAVFELPGALASGSLIFEWRGERPLLAGSLEFGELHFGPYLKALLRQRFAKLLGLPLAPRWLRRVDIDLTAWAPTSYFGPLDLSHPTVRLRGRAGRITMTLNETQIADGHMQGTLVVVPAAGGASARLTGRLEGVSAGDVAQALWPETVSLPVGQDRPPEGTVTAAVDLEGRGTTLGAVIASLDGWGAAVVRNGSLDGADIVSTLQRLASGSVLLGTGKPFIPVAGRTRFSTLIASADVRDGVVHLPRVRFKGERFEINLSGRGKLADGEVEAEGTASLYATEAPDRRQTPLVQLPFGVGGTVREPMIAPGIPRIGNRSISFSGTPEDDAVPIARRLLAVPDGLEDRLGAAESRLIRAGAEKPDADRDTAPKGRR